MKRMLALLLVILPLPALAEQCDHWTAAMEEDEGGSAMMAHICAPAGKQVSELTLQCGEAGKLWVRYVPVAPNNYPPSPDFTTDLEFSMDQEMFTRPAHYEDMDGAMVVDVDMTAPFLNVLQVQKEVMVADVNGKVPGATFPLKGSKAALKKLIAACQKQ